MWLWNGSSTPQQLGDPPAPAELALAFEEGLTTLSRGNVSHCFLDSPSRDAFGPRDPENLEKCVDASSNLPVTFLAPSWQPL